MTIARIVTLVVALVTPAIAFHLGGGTALWIANGLCAVIAGGCALYALWEDGMLEQVLKPNWSPDASQLAPGSKPANPARGLDLSSGFLVAAVMYAIVVIPWTKFIAPADEAGGLLQRCTLHGPLIPRPDAHGVTALWEFVRTQTCRGYGASLGLLGPTRAVAIVTIGALEEIAWRGGVQQTLAEKLGTTRGWLVTSLLYGLAHAASGNLLLGALALLGGLAWGGLYRFRGRLVPGIFSHMVFGYFLFHARPLVAF